MNTAPALEPQGRHALAAVRQILRHHLGSGAARVVRLQGGISNLVYAVKHGQGEFIARLSPDRAKVRAFARERAVTDRARAAGVPAPEVLDVGDRIVPYAYMLRRRASGREATHFPDRGRVLRAVGRYASLVNGIRTYGFGVDFTWEPPELRDFHWFLTHELRLEARLDLLARYDMLPSAALRRLARILESACAQPRSAALSHGDLRLKNVLVDPAGEITAIIDWEHCISCPAPYWEWSIALHDLSIDEKQDFLEGYGCSAGDVAEAAPLVKAFNLLNYVPAIEYWARREDAAAIHRIRTRLRGWLDLYSV